MKASSATSAKPTATARRTGRSSGKRPPTRTSAEGFALTGPACLPDPAFNAYRKDLADLDLAGEVLASHYAESVARIVTTAADLKAAPADDAEMLRNLDAGETFRMLEDSLGWAWGYAASDHRVGYVRSDKLTSAS